MMMTAPHHTAPPSLPSPQRTAITVVNMDYIGLHVHALPCTSSHSPATQPHRQVGTRQPRMTMPAAGRLTGHILIGRWHGRGPHGCA
jgi:hypothetical protein